MPSKFDFSKGFGDLEKHLSTRSYIEGFSFSAADSSTFSALPSVPVASSHPNAYRWYLHIASLTGLKKILGGDGRAVASASKKASAPAVATDDDDMDLFGDDDEDSSAKPTMSRAEQVAAMKAEKEAKEKANKKRDRSQIVLEVKPTDTEVNLDELYKTIKEEICPSGLTWGEGYNKSPVAFGIFKLIISMVVYDDEVSIDDVVEKIEAMEDSVQSVDINSFNKL
ncbi:ef-1 guanine nucleotide exchange domain-containing [Nannochloropsis gaditana]|uniref:Ef-1 guanine nucleotide exchange domain-containing n=1 Tax=Nannochloropsis gaditana TaxID=72520 RepID=W7U370_9STRA|nr:ef-1 guanine nucleotide exchange domain-containing [Nannochloropsis gaditana]